MRVHVTADEQKNLGGDLLSDHQGQNQNTEWEGAGLLPAQVMSSEEL